MIDTKLAWLAGLIDGEGSVGAHRVAGGKRMTGCIQMSMTCAHTMETVRALLLDLGITAVAHHHQERDPTRHQDAHYWCVSRVADVVMLCQAVLPYSITKRHHLQLLLELAQSRLGDQKLDGAGRIASRNRKPFSSREWEIQGQLSQLNLRGAAAMARSH